MCVQYDLDSWIDFAPAIRELRHKYGYHEIELDENKTFKAQNVVLFRGHANDNWQLETTLERKTKKRIDVSRYMIFVDGCSKPIESFTDRVWQVPSYPDLRTEVCRVQDAFRVHLPAYEFLVYLRHHGFPSPLLDWTQSPYIAAFFAFWDSPARDCAGRVAIYAYIESLTGGTSSFAGAPMISVRGPHVRTDRRHFAQKACYTVATEWDSSKNEHYFCSHHKVFEQSNPEQDLLIKITLPHTARREALKELMLDYNIDPYTLFQSEDSLVKSMELKEFDLDDFDL